jgi:hypothetical protein
MSCQSIMSNAPGETVMGTHLHALLRLSAIATRRALLLAGASALTCQCAVVSADESAARNERTNVAGNVQYSARLSVLNGGHRRGQGLAPEQFAKETAGLPDLFAEARPELSRSRWTFLGANLSQGNISNVATPSRALPIAGDFDGDGQGEVGVFIDGQWFIDLNSNGVWDQEDLWARLGGAGDQPLVGDWDGDGKSDIGVFGVDATAVGGDAGLPDADNAGASQTNSTATGQSGRPARLAKGGVAGDLLADPVDHVLLFGSEPGSAVAGDFNGDGVDTVAVFRNGRWTIDVDGDGRASAADAFAEFGGADDLPVAGDFNGDGIDEIGVYRSGKWLIQTDIKAPAEEADVIELGGPRFLPVVGDWDGDGCDDLAVYRDK